MSALPHLNFGWWLINLAGWIFPGRFSHHLFSLHVQALHSYFFHMRIYAEFLIHDLRLWLLSNGRFGIFILSRRFGLKLSERPFKQVLLILDKLNFTFQLLLILIELFHLDLELLLPYEIFLLNSLLLLLHFHLGLILLGFIALHLINSFLFLLDLELRLLLHLVHEVPIELKSPLFLMTLHQFLQLVALLLHLALHFFEVFIVDNDGNAWPFRRKIEGAHGGSA